MSSRIFSVLFLFLSLAAGAETFQTEIVKIVPAKHPGQEHLVYLLHDGMVGFLKPDQKSSLSILQKQFTGKRLVEVTLDERHRITAIKETDQIVKTPFREKMMQKPKVSTHARPLGIMNDAWTIFSNMRTDWTEYSECYNRAHVWAYEASQDMGVYSMKVFLFFTERYIYEYDYGWWFHISPFVYDGGETVLDRTFTGGPMGMQDWTDHFMYNYAYCPEVWNYSEYEQNQYENDCYLIKESMYFWQPYDVEAKEYEGYEKTGFVDWEVGTAYSQGFGL